MRVPITSPDGVLTLVMEGDAVGFAGLPWHTHADILAELGGMGEAEAVARFVDALVSGRTRLCLVRRDGVLVDAWPADDGTWEARLGEVVEVRTWLGAGHP